MFELGYYLWFDSDSTYFPIHFCAPFLDFGISRGMPHGRLPLSVTNHSLLLGRLPQAITSWSMPHGRMLPDMGQYQIFVQYQYQNFIKFGFQNQYQYQNSSKSFSISKSKFSHTQYQNQYTNFSKSKINIKTNIKIVKILILIIKIFWDNFFLLFNLLWILCHLRHHLVIHIEPKT